MKKAHPTPPEAEDLLKHLARQMRFADHRSPIRLFRDTATDTGAYRIWSGALIHLRRFRAVSLALKWLARFFALLETGTLLLLAIAVFFVLLPLFLLSLGAFLLAARFRARADLARFTVLPPRLHIHVFFSVGQFGLAQARQISLQPDRVALVLKADTSLPRPPLFLNVYPLGERLFLIRRHFYPLLFDRFLQNAETVLVF